MYNNKAAATYIDEYVPTKIPHIKAAEKLIKVGPPIKTKGRSASNVVPAVIVVLERV
jgi:hypothetical protein